MALGLSSGDASSFKCLFLMAIMYGVFSIIAYSIIHMKHITPLDLHAPPHRFSEARALQHIRVLSKDIGGRQEGNPGLEKAARYIKGQLELLKNRAGPTIRVEVEEDLVDGSFNMIFLGRSISLGYRNHKNIVMRISSIDSQENEPSVMVNGHFDSPLGSPGAGDCGSCVASMLELARVIVDSGWVPPKPLLFLFNGAEELFMLGSHGFMKTHKWRNTIGAFINVEASGTGGPDLVCQSGPGAWPSLLYAESAVYPMAHSAAQDVFPVIPGDTDYRIFAQDYGNIPGLDIIFMFGGYFYHTSYDTVERIIPGSVQARGENLFSLVRAFASSSKLRNASELASRPAASYGYEDDRAVFFDYFSWFMIIYPRWMALILHSIPTIIFLFVPLASLNSGLYSWFTALFHNLKGVLVHTSGFILGIIFPILFATIRLLFASHGMNWFAHPYLAFLMFVPCSLVGLLIPRILRAHIPLSQDVSDLNTSKESIVDEAQFWGVFGFYAFLTLAYTSAGLSGGFLAFFLSASMLPGWICFLLSIKSSGKQSARSILFYVVPQIPCLAYSVYFGGFLIQFFIEKMGMMGSLPPPHGYFIPDIIVATVIGLVTGLCVGPLLAVAGQLLARSNIVQFLLHLSVLTLALSSHFFPYTKDAPKRVVFQHTIITADGNQILDSTYDISVVDSNSLPFLFKNAPEAAGELSSGSELSFIPNDEFHRETFLAIFPVSFLFSRSLRFAANSDKILKRYKEFPLLSIYKQESFSDKGHRKVHLELCLGSLEEVWAAVLNITGPLSGWSFADHVLPAPEIVDGGPPSYVSRLSGKSHQNWTFWLEANSSEALRVEVAVLDQYLVDGAKKLKGLFPDWVDVIAYSSFMSTYII